MIFNLENNEIKKQIIFAEYGLEREGLRVNPDGTLAMTSHPFENEPNIDRDFCENQTEIITDVFTDVDSLIGQMEKIHDKIFNILRKNNELFWSFSNPPKIGDEKDIPAAVFSGSMKHKNEYRKYLAEKYGKKKMLFSGIHFNFSFSPELIEAAFKMSGYSDKKDFKNSCYLQLSKRLTQYSWLIVYLTAASPVTDISFGIPSSKYSSVRCGEEGYWNKFVPILDYSDFSSYVHSIEQYIEKGELTSVSELYYPVRLKPKGNNSLESLVRNGINHIELRVLDVNPLSRTGIFKEDILFIHLLMLYLVSMDESDFDKAAQREAIDNIKAAAVFGNAGIKQRAETELNKLSDFAGQYFPQFSDILKYQKKKLADGCSYAEIISKNYSKDYIAKGIMLAKQYAGGNSDV